MHHLLILGLMLLPPSPVHQSPVILMSSDLDREINHFDLKPELALGATGWLGLYEGQDGWRLEEADVDITIREGGDRLDFTISSDLAGAELLFSGIANLSAGPAIMAGQATDLAIWDPAVQIVVEEDFRLGDERYTVQLESLQEDRCDIVVTLSRGATSQVLFGEAGDQRAALGPGFNCDEPHFRIHWAGDLDGDGRLDLLVTFTGKYSHHPRQLLLSSAASHGELVAHVGTYEPY